MVDNDNPNSHYVNNWFHLYSTIHDTKPLREDDRDTIQDGEQVPPQAGLLFNLLQIVTFPILFQSLFNVTRDILLPKLMLMTECKLFLLVYER